MNEILIIKQKPNTLMGLSDVTNWEETYQISLNNNKLIETVFMCLELDIF